MKELAEIIRSARKKSGWTQHDLAAASGVHASTIERIEQGRPPSPNRHTRVSLAKALKLPEKLLMEDRPVIEAPPHALVDLPMPPAWDIECSASHWVPVPKCILDYDDPDQRRVVNYGHFQLRIAGDCMTPDYPDGAIVQFQILRNDDPRQFRIDDAYVFCRSDDTATFKRLAEWDTQTITLYATNQKKYPGAFTVPTQEVVRVAGVVGVLVKPEPRPVKILS